jgi:hypothetical protein
MQCRLAHPLKQPCRGQSKTGSMQSLELHEFGPPSSELEPPLSGNMNGGSMKPLELEPELEPDDEVARVPVSSVVDASSEVTVASSDETAASSDPGGGLLASLPELEPLPLEELPELPLSLPDPLPLDEAPLPPEEPFAGPPFDAHPAAPTNAVTRIVARIDGVARRARASLDFEGIFTPRMLNGPRRHRYLPCRTMSCHFRPLDLHDPMRGGYFPDPREIAGARRNVCAPMVETVLSLAAAVADLFRGRWSLLAEIALLRHQLTVLATLGWQAACDSV